MKRCTKFNAKVSNAFKIFVKVCHCYLEICIILMITLYSRE